MCKVESFFYFIDLRNGTFIIGIFDAIAYLVLVIIDIKDFKTVMAILTKIFYITHIIASLVLIFAAVKHLTQYCFPWLITSLVIIIKFIVHIFLVSSEYGFEIRYLFLPIIFLILAIYFWIVGYSYASQDYYIEEELQAN